MKRVEVVWLDAETKSGWQDISEAEADFDSTATVCHNIGYLVHENESHVVLISGYNDSEYSEVTKIPRGMVKSMVEVAPVEKGDSCT
jgi:hypothetical protein